MFLFMLMKEEGNKTHDTDSNAIKWKNLMSARSSRPHSQNNAIYLYSDTAIDKILFLFVIQFHFLPLMAVCIFAGIHQRTSIPETFSCSNCCF